MLFTCPCDQRVIDISIRVFLMISDAELERLCTADYGTPINDPWYDSILETQGVILTTEEIELKEEQEYEENDAPNFTDLNLQQDFWEE